MSRPSRLAFIIIPLFALALAGCGDGVEQAKTAAELRAAVESTFQAMEMQRTVPGLQHRHITVEPDSDIGGYAVKIYDLKLGAAAIGFQSFTMMTFTLSGDDKRFTAENFKFTPRAVSDAPDSAPGILMGQLQSWASSIVLKD